MKRIGKGVVWLCAWVLAVSVSRAAPAVTNYCYNSDFTSAKGPLDGWHTDYDWTRNKHQMGNHKNASVLPVFRAKEKVLKMAVPSGFETKVETPLIPYEPGDRYECTFDICVENVAVNILFQGYNLKPGISPDETPNLQNLRRMYKAEYVTAKGAVWKNMRVTIPNEKVSPVAYSHLKKVRYITVLMYVPGATYFKDGNFYVTNLKIVKLPEKARVTQ
ncbi:MAG: hypothetical protein RBT78_07740 [Kiritimatiellia bacterium]|jgi:hypothetical protein|nr:hypothetical protein [Kiritimatiellia bacterium]